LQVQNMDLKKNHLIGFVSIKPNKWTLYIYDLFFFQGDHFLVLQTQIFYSSKFARLKNGFLEWKKIPCFGFLKMEHE